MNIESITNNREQVVASIQKAARANQVDFDYLLTQAKVESALNPEAKAKTSSATGLFQFTSGTWLNVVRRHGDKVGLSAEAAALNNPNVSDASVSKVLALRKEPHIAAELAARFALDNAKALNAAGHASIGPTELYLAHFLGAGGATTFLNGLRDNPDRAAASALPQAANANTPIFYNGAKPRSYREIYDRFAQKFQTASATSLTASAPKLLETKDLRLGMGLSDRKISDIANKILAEARTSQNMVATPVAANATSTPAPTMTPAEIGHVSEEALTQYLKGFGLVDHANGLAPNTGRISRDASRGADVKIGSMDQSGDLTPLAQGARLVLKATNAESDRKDLL